MAESRFPQLHYSVLVILSVLCSFPRLWADTFGQGANSFSIPFVTIGGAGTPPNELDKLGGVPYEYSISTNEISRDLIVKANALGGVGLTLADMTNFGGSWPNHPATGISWYEAAAFVNWLNTSSGLAPAYNLQGGHFELWKVGDAGFDSGNPYRSSRAQYVIPSADEWYKAAYYSPQSAEWFVYPTATNSPPQATAGGSAVGTAVILQGLTDGPADVFSAGGASPSGTVGQGGNVWEWEETAFDYANGDPQALRGIRGGSWFFGSAFTSSSTRSTLDPAVEDFTVGFRVARVTRSPQCDLNRDRAVDAADAGVLFGSWGQSGEGDLLTDGIVDAADAGICFAEWTGDQGATRNAVPEPSATTLWTALAAMSLARLQRKWRADSDR